MTLNPTLASMIRRAEEIAALSEDLDYPRLKERVKFLAFELRDMMWDSISGVTFLVVLDPEGGAEIYLTGLLESDAAHNPEWKIAASFYEAKAIARQHFYNHLNNAYGVPPHVTEAMRRIETRSVRDLPGT